MKIEALLTRPEGKTLEFKQDLSSPKNFLKTLTAFANTAGGETTNRRADGPLTAELRRSALNLSYNEEPLPDINPDNLNVRVASGLFAGLRAWSENTPETLRLTIRHQGRLVPTVGGVLLFGSVRER